MANKAAAGSAMSLGLDNVTIALFVPVDNNDVIAKLSGEPQKIRAVRVRFDKYKGANFNFGKKNPSE